MITLRKLRSVKMKKHFFSILNKVKAFYKKKLKNNKKFKMLLFLTHFNSLLHSLMFSGGIAMQHWTEVG